MREFETGPLVAAAGATALLVSLFLDWFATDAAGEEGFSGWTSFEVLDLLLAGLALATLAAAASRLGAPQTVPRRALPWLGAAATVIVASQLVQHPPVGIERDPAEGAWLALAGSLVMLVGGVVALARVSLAVQVAAREEQAAAAAAAQDPYAPAPTDPAAPAPAPAPGDYAPAPARPPGTLFGGPSAEPPPPAGPSTPPAAGGGEEPTERLGEEPRG